MNRDSGNVRYPAMSERWEIASAMQITRSGAATTDTLAIQVADHIGGSARGYPAGFGSLAARLQPIAIGPNLYFYAAPRSE
jgi:hypothetical protein